eukprot:symbB.v1.2.032367.t2/scaffold3882.1/size48875/3
MDPTADAEGAEELLMDAVPPQFQMPGIPTSVSFNAGYLKLKWLRRECGLRGAELPSQSACSCASLARNGPAGTICTMVT